MSVNTDGVPVYAYVCGIDCVSDLYSMWLICVASAFVDTSNGMLSFDSF